MTVVNALAARPDELSNLVERHRVSFECFPIWHIPGSGTTVTVGYELDLIGTHDHAHDSDGEACVDCRPVQEALVAIARGIQAPSGEAGRRRNDFDVAFHFSPRGEVRKNVVLAIDVVHRQRAGHPIDGSELRYLQEMQEKLKSLGVRTARACDIQGGCRTPAEA